MKALFHGSVMLPLMVLLCIHTSTAQDSVATFAGQPLVSGSSNGFGTNALFSDPTGLAFDPEGNLFLADSQNHAIRKIDRAGLVSTLAGQLGISGQSNGALAHALFDSPCGITLDQHGNLFVSDTGNHAIRKISTNGVVTTLAGVPGQSGFADGLAGAALFSSPLGLKLAPNGMLFVCDSGNHLLRSIAPNGQVTTFAGSPGIWGTNDGQGAAAHFNGPVGLVIDEEGDLFVSDSNNHAIRKITPAGLVSTWAGIPGVPGFSNGDARTATFCNPAELALDHKHNLFVADSFNHVIRMVSSDRKVSTVSGLPGASGTADGINGQARFFSPYGIAISQEGSLVVADAYNQVLRTLLPPFTLTIQSVRSNGSVTISWASVIGKTYQLQSRNRLSPDDWVNLGSPVTATQTTSRSEDSPVSAQPRFYRVITQ